MRVNTTRHSEGAWATEESPDSSPAFSGDQKDKFVGARQGNLEHNKNV
jgi:hypothetical protein